MSTFMKVGAAICIVALSACSTSEAAKQTRDTSSAVVNAPAKAFNLKKAEIPAYLTDLGNPYEGGRFSSCATLSAEVAQLTEFLGPDWDSPDHYSNNKKGVSKGEFFDSILPYGGVARLVSGASKHEKKVLESIDYASVRRAHLKTIAVSKGCPL